MFAARSRRAVAAALAAVLLAACGSGSTSLPTPAPTVAPTTLLTRLGTDTIAIEQYTRTATHMDGVLVSRSPSTRVSRYSIAIGRTGAPTRVDFSVRDGNNMALPNELQSLSVRYSADSVYLVGHRSTGDTARAFAVRGPVLPYTNNSYALYELAFARLLASGRDSGEFAVVPLNIAARTPTPLAVKLIGADSARINFFGFPLYARRDTHGRIIALDGTKTTVKVRVERVATADIEALARDWAAREQAGASLGAASTRDTVRATIGAAHVWIDYGRPALRGRDVWQNGVLGDTLWRTGANAATQLHSDAELVIGGVTVPAGTYSLWTATTPSGYQLVINRQFGQWGTDYDRKRDLARVALHEASVATPVERFTIELQPQGASGAQLAFTWGAKQLSVPVATR